MKWNKSDLSNINPSRNLYFMTSETLQTKNSKFLATEARCIHRHITKRLETYHKIVISGCADDSQCSGHAPAPTLTGKALAGSTKAGTLLDEPISDRARNSKCGIFHKNKHVIGLTLKIAAIAENRPVL
jgi:hypothetical protein